MAILRDKLQALGFSIETSRQSGGKPVIRKDYENTMSVPDALYSHTRVKMPFGLTVIGY
jgi:hypothetical protein